MSKRCELQKEYYQQYGNYKGVGKYNDDYVKWLESEVLALRLTVKYNRSKHIAIPQNLAQTLPVLITVIHCWQL